MNPEFSLGDITFSINGVEMGTMQAIDVKTEYINTPEKELKNGEDLKVFSLSRGATLTLENAVIEEEFLNKMIPKNTTYKVIATSINYPRGNKLPKKKRIRNKWIKKYHQEITLDNCVII